MSRDFFNGMLEGATLGISSAWLVEALHRSSNKKGPIGRYLGPIAILCALALVFRIAT